jgi:hypothetical protein
MQLLPHRARFAAGGASSSSRARASFAAARVCDRVVERFAIASPADSPNAAETTNASPAPIVLTARVVQQ